MYTKVPLTWLFSNFLPDDNFVRRAHNNAIKLQLSLIEWEGVIDRSKSKGRWSLPFAACFSFRLNPTANSIQRGFADVDHGQLPFVSGIKASFQECMQTMRLVNTSIYTPQISATMIIFS